jgi:hypothetical protein
MSLASDLLHPFSKLEDAVKAIVLQSLVQEYGSFAHTLCANSLHDACDAR